MDFTRPYLSFWFETNKYNTSRRHLRDLAESIDVEYEEIYEQPKEQNNENDQETVD